MRKTLQVSGDGIYLKGRKEAYMKKIHYEKTSLIHYAFIYSRDKGEIYCIPDIISGSGEPKMNN